MSMQFSIAELLALELPDLPKSKSGLTKRIKTEAWAFIEVAAKGGKGGVKKMYTPPPAILKQIQAQQAEKLLAETAPAPLPAVQADTREDALAGSTAAQRNQEGARLAVLQEVEKLMTQTGVGKDAAITTLLTQAKQAEYPHLAAMLAAANDKRGGGGGIPSSRTIKRWFAQREASGNLIAKKIQADMRVPAWLNLFLQHWQQPMKPSVERAYLYFVSDWAAQKPLEKPPSVHAVRRALAKMGMVSRQVGRKGARELKNDLPFTRREFLHLPPAAIYTADGHQFDAEVLNPLSGKPFRPEITTVLDIATRRLMGWSVGLAESRFTVLEALCHASRTAIGAVWYVDWGKGFENLMMTDEAVGLMGRLGMTMKHARAYNSQAKGASERSHQIFTHAAKALPSYIGKDMDDEARKTVYRWSRKEIKLHGKIINSPIPTWDEFKAYVEAIVDDYNNRPHRSLPKITDANGKKRHLTPHEMWALKVKEFGEPPKVGAEEEGWLFRPQIVRTVRRGEISIFNNVYFSEQLNEYNGLEMRVGYDVQDAQWVWVYDDAGRLVCKAEWNGNSQSYYPESVVAQAIDKRTEARIKRAEVRVQDALAERRGAALLEHQPSVNLGGMVLDLSGAELAAKGEAAMVRLAERANADKQQAVVVPVSEVQQANVWRVPETAAERFAEYWRICDRADLPDAAARWVKRYPQSHEYQAMHKQAA
ncbi:Mu transposase C-terminal domain-containing protein [Conchiformibius steedae DSM 2580]|uniref:Mu transposase C-terminal domain-containing protein n=1 Tax=Conchiformibius steedae DSM 2580 TaxID=1121352 RepID=A0AAE9HXF5_9NEIS|nr:Mu transposase C-terminal domain-containing protein [Conchiformibius steedae]QMT33489.1 Mu transposase C-terminal domain-containing protein [Conchiformibius steedae]URD68147.1 Mu transposase C-terminal domain-containing protein [Conchiformibius steedae DSM 2580]